MGDINATDAMVFEAGDKWWMLVNTTTLDNKDHSSQLTAYYTDDLFSGRWIAHDSNPLVFDSTCARNAGLLHRKNALPIRCRQRQGFNKYGAGLSFAAIEELTPDSFAERKIGEITPDFFKGITGCHHLHSNGEYTVYEYLQSASRK